MLGLLVGATRERTARKDATANGKGEILRRQRLTGEYKRGLPNGEVAWQNVSELDAEGATGAFVSAHKSGYH
jgi:hypothetical protein